MCVFHDSLFIGGDFTSMKIGNQVFNYNHIAKFYGNNITTSIKESSKSSINVYPNPSNGEIRFDIKERSEIKIYNAIGQLIKSVSEENPFTLNLDKGFYIAEIYSNNKRTNINLIIE